MLSLFARGRKAPQDLFSIACDEPIRLDEAKLAAWALALGEIRNVADPPASRRPHRGMLPDVDLANAVPIQRRSLLRLVAAALATRLAPVAVLGDMAPRGVVPPAASPAPASEAARGRVASPAGFGRRTDRRAA